MLKVTKRQSFSVSLEDTFLEKPQGGRGVQIAFRVKDTLILFDQPFWQSNTLFDTTNFSWLIYVL